MTAPSPPDPCRAWSPSDAKAFKKGLAAIAEKWTDYRRQEARASELEHELWLGLNCIGGEYRDLKHSVTSVTGQMDSRAGEMLAKMEGQRNALERIAAELKAIAKKCGACVNSGSDVFIADTNTSSSLYVKTWFDNHGLELLNNWRAVIQDLRTTAQTPKAACSANCCPKCDANGTASGLSDQIRALAASTTAFQVSMEALLHALLAAQKVENGVPGVTDSRQFDPEKEIRTFILDDAAQIEVAMVTVPDPRVPRHRRAYDNAIDAISNAMLIAGFVMDRFSFPWQAALAKSANIEASSREVEPGHSGIDEKKFTINDPQFGLIVFRSDSWRSANASSDAFPPTRYRLVYVVPETATYGIQRAAFKGVVAKIESELSTAGNGRVKLASSGFCPKEEFMSTEGGLELVVFGPTYSGTIESIRAFRSDSAAAARQIAGLCLLSATATASTNKVLKHYIRPQSPLRVSSVAVSDAKRLDFVTAMRGALNVAPSRVAFLYEATIFGNDICGLYLEGPEKKIACGEALQVPFPVNIADVRYGLQADALAAKKDQKTEIRLPSSIEQHLHLEEGAENGSEFPQSDQSRLTTAGNQFNLEHAISAIAERHPQIVVIVATDVRDQLFLIEQVHRQIEGALLVVFGADRLLAHPDFINSSRGAIAVASSILETCIAPRKNGSGYRDKNWANVVDCAEVLKSAVQDTTWVTDDQALLAKAILSWEPSMYPVKKSSNSCTSGPLTEDASPCPFLVARDGVQGPNTKTITFKALKYVPLLAAYAGMMTAALVFFGLRKSNMPPASRVASELRGELFSRDFRVRLGAVGLFLLLVFVLNWLRLGPWRVPLVGISTFLLAVLFHGAFGNVGWQRLMVWLVFSSFFALIATEYWHAMFGAPDFANFGLAFLDQIVFDVSKSAMGGLSYPLAILVALVILLATGWAVAHIGGKLQLSRQCLNLSLGNVNRLDRPLFEAGRTALVLLVAWLSLEVTSVIDTKLRMTIFGEAAAIAALIAMLALTAMAIAMFMGAVGASQRIFTLCAMVEESCRKAVPPGPVADEKWNPLLWDEVLGKWPRFPSTPALSFASNRRALAKQLHSMTSIGERRRLHALLVNEMSVYHWTILNTMLIALGASIVVYLFPITGADQLLMINLGVLFAMGVQSAYSSVRFEANRVLSNVLCNRSRKMELSAELFTYIAFPFGALAIAIAIAEVPGVLNWGDGLFSLVLEVLKPKL